MSDNPFRLGSRGLTKRPNVDTKNVKRVVYLSVEGTKTECDYFKYVNLYQKELGIDALIRIEVLKRLDTSSDVEHVFELLDQYVKLRNSNNLIDSIKSAILQVSLNEVSDDLINQYINNQDEMSRSEKTYFETLLRNSRIDLLYLDYLYNLQKDYDKFAVVVDRDMKSHTQKQMYELYRKCMDRNYLCIISNPCFEFWLLLHVCDVEIIYANCLDKLLENPIGNNGQTYVSDLLHDITSQRKAIQKKQFDQFYLNTMNLAIKRSKRFAKGEELINNVGSNVDELITILRQTNMIE